MIPVWMLVCVCLPVFASIVFLIFFLIFFRDPERTIRIDENHVLSPADGTVVDVSGNEDASIRGTKSKRIAVYLSLWDVHVQRIPVSGVVTGVEYRSGSYYPAKSRASSKRNESCLVGIRGPNGTVYVKQIAGCIARRIVCRVKEGDHVSQGERYGRIIFGSRVEVFVPSRVDVKVSRKQNVQAGQTILGNFKT